VNKGIVSGIIVLLIIIIAIAFIMNYKPIPATTITPVISSNGTSLLSLQLTDPPEVPNGTQSLVIDYSSLNAHVVEANGTGTWVAASGSGSVNLLALVNLSQIIGNANIPKGSTVDMVSFNITKASITIENITYNVTVANNKVTAHISNAQRINSSMSALIDMSPAIATIYTSNSTIFVLVPSLRAVIMPSRNASASAIGTRAAINSTERVKLDLSKPNITLSNVALSETNNVTSLSITIANNGNSNVSIKHVLLYGNESIYINATHGIGIGISKDMVHIHTDLDNNMLPGGFGLGQVSGLSSTEGISSIAANISSLYGINNSIVSAIAGSLNSSMIENISNEFNATGMVNVSKVIGRIHSFNISSSEFSDIMRNKSSFEDIVKGLNITQLESQHIGMGIDMEHFRVMDFFVSSNGTLLLPFVQGPSAEDSVSGIEGEGYILKAHTSATLTFTGIISFANGNIKVVPIPGGSYRVVVIGEEGASSSVNVTAG
jgi:hypothetical protein